MKCHYEVLNLQKNATDDEIKKSYRKLALKWHPDKNPDQLDECTKQFHLIQQAYEVLIDPQERAWYDKHREAILRGGLGHGEKYEDNCLDVYQYFNTACYSGYGDDEEGFYAVYRMVFEQIGTEDMEYMDEADHGNIPGFGDSTSDYDETVNPFYAFWESYCTAKSYVWQEKYDTREAPHRQVRRAMEQENKKLRDKAKKERNEEVRALVAFVRKRDKRVQAYKKKLEERAEEIKRLTEEKKKKQKEERLKKFENYKEADWSAMGGLEKDLRALDMVHAKNFQDMEEEFSDESEEGEEGEEGEEMAAEEQEESFYDDLYCVACNKPFKTQKAFDNHENSKKHKQNIDQLKVEMEEEEQACDMNGITEENVDRVSGEEEEDIGLDDVMYDDLYCQYCDKFFTDEIALYNHTTSKKHTDTVDSLRPPKADSDDDIDGSDADNTKTDDFTDLGANQEAANSENVDETEEQSKSKQSKKQKGKKQEENRPPVSLNCNVCNEEFTSRNKLFQHVKETNHALRLPEGQTVQMTTAKSKKNKKNKKK